MGQRVVSVRGLGATRTLQEGGVRKSDAIELARREPEPEPEPKPPKRKPQKVTSLAGIEDPQAAIVKAWKAGDAEKVLRLYPLALSAARKSRRSNVDLDVPKVRAIRLWAKAQTGR